MATVKRPQGRSSGKMTEPLSSECKRGSLSFLRPGADTQEGVLAEKATCVDSCQRLVPRLPNSPLLYHKTGSFEAGLSHTFFYSHMLGHLAPTQVRRDIDLHLVTVTL